MLWPVGLYADARFDLAVELGRIVFPYVLFISLAALLSGILNARGSFAAAAAAPILLNIVLIGAMVLARYMQWDMGQTLSWAVTIAGIAQLTLVYIAVKNLGIQFKLKLPKLSPDIKRLFILAVPAVLTGGVVQINLLVGRNVASTTEGAFAWLYYADRLYQLPLGVVGIAIGIVLLPNLARNLQAGDTENGQNSFNRALEFSLALTLPAAMALAIVPVPLISVLFERGAFTSADSTATASALMILRSWFASLCFAKGFTTIVFRTRRHANTFQLCHCCNDIECRSGYWAVILHWLLSGRDWHNIIIMDYDLSFMAWITRYGSRGQN